MIDSEIQKELWTRILFIAIAIAVWATWPRISALNAKTALPGEFQSRDANYHHYGFYETSVASWQAWEGNEILAEISYYTNRPEETDYAPNITASNQIVREGIVANNCQQFGTKVEIAGQQYEVQDRMASRYSCEHYDIFTFNLKEAIQKGRHLSIIKLVD